MVSLFFRIILVTLSLIQALLLTYLSWSTSPNRTEVGHLAACTYVWQKEKLDMFHVNPPLVRIVPNVLRRECTSILRPSELKRSIGAVRIGGLSGINGKKYHRYSVHCRNQFCFQYITYRNISIENL